MPVMSALVFFTVYWSGRNLTKATVITNVLDEFQKIVLEDRYPCGNPDSAGIYRIYVLVRFLTREPLPNSFRYS